MDLGNRRFYDLDALLAKYGAPRTNWTPRLRPREEGGKWRDQKGPNPLTLKGLERS